MGTPLACLIDVFLDPGIMMSLSASCSAQQPSPKTQKLIIMITYAIFLLHLLVLVFLTIFAEFTGSGTPLQVPQIMVILC